MEFVIGGLAATSAGFITNPLEVVKHHMELNKKSQYTQNQYKNFLQAGFNVAKKDGIKSLQKGLSPALGAHLASYGMKLGIYHYGQNRGFTTNSQGQVVVPKSVLTSGIGGVMGQYFSSPFYLLKIQHECDVIAQQSNPNNTSGEKSKVTYTDTIKNIYREHGLRGFFRGATASLPRAFIGTSQLTSFALAKENLNKFDMFKSNPLFTTLLASTIAGVVLSMCMTPFDMVLTKMYKQAISPPTPGQEKHLYTGFLDCIKRTYLENGFKPFYKGMGPLYLKLGPHTVLCLVFWEEFKGIYNSNSHNEDDDSKNFYESKFGFKTYNSSSSSSISSTSSTWRKNSLTDMLGSSYQEDLSILEADVDQIMPNQKIHFHWN